MKNKRLPLLCIIIFLIVFTLTGCGPYQNDSEIPVVKTDLFLGTVVQLKIYEPVGDEVFEKAFKLIGDIENKMSLNIPESELNLINGSAGIGPVAVSPDTYHVIETAVSYGSISSGNFDITIGPLAALWNIGKESARVPDQREIDEALKLVDYSKVVLDANSGSVFLEDPGMMLDLGGIAKGYAADQLSNLFSEEGIEHAIINLGGNIYVHGGNPDGNPWRIGIQNPEAERNDYVGVVSVKNSSVVTSGIYERFLESNGKKYHHILSPFDGYPYDNNLSGVSIIAGKSIDADALSTVVFALGQKDGLELLETIPDAEGIFLTKDHKIHMTSGIENDFELSGSQFTPAE